MSWNTVPNLFLFRSLRARLVLGYTVVLFLSILGLSAAFYYQIRKNIDTAAQDFLKNEFDMIVTLLEKEAYGIRELSNFLSKKTLLAKGPYPLSYALYDGRRQLIARSEQFATDESFLKEVDGKFGDRQGTSFIKKVKEPKGKEPPQGVLFLMTGSFKDAAGTVFYLQLGLHGARIFETFLGSIHKTTLIMLPITLIVVVLGGFLLTHRLLLPISELAKSAKNLSITDFSRGLPIRGTGDEIDHLSVTFNDVFKRLSASYQRIVQFTADASHELRLPITAIKGEAEIVLERERSLEEYRKTLGNIIEEMDRLSLMIGKLLRLARADSGADHLEKSNVHLYPLLKKMLEFLTPLYEGKKLEVSLKQEGPDEFYGDQDRLEELFSSLLENAIKFTPSGGRIDLLIQGHPQELCVDIRDTGIGIAPEEQQKIFERFYRVDKSRARSEGSSGLGLSIAESIVLAHGGKITVESSLGQGSCFHIILPHRPPRS
ncbi:MAG: ATP-binding protein [Candidatus Omnitrophica bacterium]|nr:ATP-binding protein [Candidatus Omnitrophota bacterium]